MADKQISSLPQAQTVDDDSLFILEQQGTAMKATGAQWKGCAQQAVSQYVTQAQQAANQALQASKQALDAVENIGTAVEDTQANVQAAQTAQDGAEAAETGAEAARDAILNMLVEAITLETGQPATVSKALVDGVFKLTFGLPKGKTGEPGEQGPQGVSVESIQFTSGSHAPGTTDTYTITLSNGSKFAFTVYNGANGDGTGDFMASGVVPMTGNLQMGGNKVTNLGAPTDDSDGTTKEYVDEGLSDKQGILTGAEGQLVGFNSEGKVVPVEAPDPLPSGGTVGQVLTMTENGPAWQDAPEGGITQDEADARYLQLSGGALSGGLKINSYLELEDGNNSVSAYATDKNGVDCYLEFETGGVGITYLMQVGIDQPPTGLYDIANKEYGDAQISAAIGAAIEGSY